MQQLEVTCNNLYTRISSPANNATQDRASPTRPIDDRASNLMVFGLAEDVIVLYGALRYRTRFLHVAGRPVDIEDAFCIGKYTPTNNDHVPLLLSYEVNGIEHLAKLCPQTKRTGQNFDELVLLLMSLSKLDGKTQ